MHSLLTHLLGPELVMGLIVGLVWLLCHAATVGDPSVVRWAERGVWLLPLVAVGLTFATLAIPALVDEPLSWWRLARSAIASLVGPCIAVWFIVHLFGPGARGQDAAFIITLLVAGIATSLGLAIGGACVLADRHDSVAEWFRTRPVVGSVLTLMAAIPIGVVLFPTVSVGGGMLIGLVLEFRR